MSEHKVSSEHEKFRREAALKIYVKAMTLGMAPKAAVANADALIEALEKKHERS